MPDAYLIALARRQRDINDMTAELLIQMRETASIRFVLVPSAGAHSEAGVIDSQPTSSARVSGLQGFKEEQIPSTANEVLTFGMFRCVGCVDFGADPHGAKTALRLPDRSEFEVREAKPLSSSEEGLECQRLKLLLEGPWRQERNGSVRLGYGLFGSAACCQISWAGWAPLRFSTLVPWPLV